MLRLLLGVLLMAVALPAEARQSYAEPKSQGGECVLRVDGTTYIDGPCTYVLSPDGSFQFESSDRQIGYFAVVNLDEGLPTATGWWNAEEGARHAHDPLGTLVRTKACWVNEHATVCAWKAGTRPRR